MGFHGFRQAALTFLQDIQVNNSKEWFDEHRSIYQQELLKPFCDLVDALSQTVLEIDPLIETRAAVGKTLSRIYRDTRFSQDKSRYHGKMWLSFQRRSEHKSDSPCFFFGIRPDHYSLGIGYYSASRPTMQAFRELILQDPHTFMLVAKSSRQAPFELTGESYKRPLIKDQPSELADWYNRKSLSLVASSYEIEKVFSADLVTELQTGFEHLADFYRYLLQVEAVKQAKRDWD